MCLLLNPAWAQPVINSFSPSSGPIGTTVTITGTGFNATAANNVVFFGAAKAQVASATATSLQVTVPKGVTYQPVSVLSQGFTAFSRNPFNVVFTGCDTITNNSFASYSFLPTSTNPRKPATFDLADDGKPDIGFVNYSSNSAYIYPVAAQGSGAVIPLVTGTAPVNIVAADMDGDGKRDIVTGSSSSGFSVFRNNSTGGNLYFDTKIDFNGFFFNASESNPEIPSALRFYHIKQGIVNKFIIVEDLYKLTPEQIKELKESENLKEKIKSFLSENNKRSTHKERNFPEDDTFRSTMINLLLQINHLAELNSVFPGKI